MNRKPNKLRPYGRNVMPLQQFVQGQASGGFAITKNMRGLRDLQAGNTLDRRIRAYNLTVLPPD